ncbi:outer membrane beta-barrel protein [Helicobacter sp. MIT 03-1616]|uniref:outer membrane beta-barrel protein n=1 Tax=Helicobacter sp. MIT 03-1616 TaxID=1548148 RepID=UPI00051DBB11|nr:outer membrane beta-barrel protein [Helicobacter sp. MIT 03-1616]TLD88828.1 outer membrane beta-barrel protein [Helicobacter sp. MIT 03-1616]
MKKHIFAFVVVAVANLLNAGESGVFIGGSLSLNNTSYSGVYSTLENNITTDYPHSNYSHNAFGASARIGYQKFSSDARFGGRFYVEYDNNGYATYRDENGAKRKMDAYSLALNADVLFDIKQFQSAVFGIFAGGGLVLSTHKFPKSRYSIYKDSDNSPATLEGYGLSAQAGLSLTFLQKHRVELEVKYANFVSSYDSDFIHLGTKAESLKLEAQGFLNYRLNYIYVF